MKCEINIYINVCVYCTNKYIHMKRSIWYMHINSICLHFQVAILKKNPLLSPLYGVYNIYTNVYGIQTHIW